MNVEGVDRFLTQFELMRSMMSRLAKGDQAEKIERDIINWQKAKATGQLGTWAKRQVKKKTKQRKGVDSRRGFR